MVDERDHLRMRVFIGSNELRDLDTPRPRRDAAYRPGPQRRLIPSRDAMAASLYVQVAGDIVAH
jgi:hypothetical protein